MGYSFSTFLIFDILIFNEISRHSSTQVCDYVLVLIVSFRQIETPTYLEPKNCYIVALLIVFRFPKVPSTCVCAKFFVVILTVHLHLC